MPEQRAAIEWALANADGGKDGALFTPWTNASRDMQRACKALGIPGCSLNDLRRSYATWLGRVGIRDELIDLALGHKPKKVGALHYRKLDPLALIRLVEEEYQARAANRPAGWWLSEIDDADTRTSVLDTRTDKIGHPSSGVEQRFRKP